MPVGQPFELPVPYRRTNPGPIDFLYTPDGGTEGYDDVAQVLAIIPPVLRYDGLTVKIKNSGEFWWEGDDLSDAGLKQKSSNRNGNSNDVYYQRREVTITTAGSFTVTEPGAVRYLDVFIAEKDSDGNFTGNVGDVLFPGRGYTDSAPTLTVNPPYKPTSGLRVGDIISYAWFGPDQDVSGTYADSQYGTY